ncbi:hypothetical protein BACPLE_01181 [Phocaeicola plebeius DSM 17135]|uniref:Uncharacterized protein n=1 Tax=Phocaeicola plebeius (strain DSM 17135 / JCM 12973 / CCUG 54634 / M2) TaxID=484018 RepID=B5CWU1_PHOPM|nr:hypothetical protein BACPLE_01181 [Phocaeicola plebeius DSM 17135]
MLCKLTNVSKVHCLGRHYKVEIDEGIHHIQFCNFCTGKSEFQ